MKLEVFVEMGSSSSDLKYYYYYYYELKMILGMRRSWG